MQEKEYIEMGKNIIINDIIKMELELEFEYEEVETKEEYFHSRKEYLLKQSCDYLFSTYAQAYELLYYK